MAQHFQIDFFAEDDFSMLSSKIESLKLSQDKQRKKLFAENGILKKKVTDLEYRLEIIEKGLCNV